MRVEVDMNLCASHGQCEFVAPEVFALDDDGELTYVTERDPDEADAVRQAVRA